MGSVVYCRPGRGGPPEDRWDGLFDLPPRVLLEPVVMPALRTGVTEAAPAASLVGCVVFEIALIRRASTGRAGACGVPNLGQVEELGGGVVAWARVPVIALVGGNGLKRD